MASASVITTAMVDAAFRKTAAQAKPKGSITFHEGDLVVYPAHGVGKIDRIGPENVAGHKLNIIQISFTENRMVLRVPVVSAGITGLRKLATKEALAEALVTLRGRRRTSRLMWTKRAMAYQAKINSGDLHSLAEVVRDLQASADGSGSSSSQRNLFEIALDRLAGEFAAVANTDKAEQIERLTRALQPSNTSQVEHEPAEHQPAGHQPAGHQPAGHQKVAQDAACA